MNISFAITVHNEGELIDRLLTQLTEFIEDKENGDEIVILDDYSVDLDTVNFLETYSNLPYVHLHRRALERDFGAQKNHLNTLCNKDYIFQIDADELLAPELLEHLHPILDANINIDLFYIPRVNTVEGLTQDHIQTWGWNVNEHGWVLWPDWQTRFYRNKQEIVWCGKVHERIDGYVTFTYLPQDPKFAILHHKSIERQEEQNAFYSEILLSAQDFE